MPAGSRKTSISQTAFVLPLSAATAPSLEARVADFADYNFGETDMADLAYTLGSRRTHLPMRGFLVAPRSENISFSFQKRPFVSGATLCTAPCLTPFAFVFTGQGSQWAGMCRELFFNFPVFRNAIAEMASVLQTLPHAPDWLLSEAILSESDPSLIHLPSRSQPCCTAIQVALVQLLHSWDIHPAMTVGHSSGEIAAAFAAGHLSAAEAIVIAYYRGYCVSKASPRDGAMMATGLSEADATAAISRAGLNDRIRVACVNSPESTTVSGDASAIDTLLAILQEKGGVFARKLKTGGQAYHSHHMLAIGAEYESLMDEVLPALDPSVRQPQSASVMSSVTGQVHTSGFAPSYWRRNLEGQVRFAQAIGKIQQQSAYCFLELGPHSSLELPIKQTLAKAGVSGADVQYAAPIKRSTDALESVLSLAGSLWLKGYEMNWAKINGLQGLSKAQAPSRYRVVTDLPPYRFNYEETLWHECRSSSEYRQRRYPRHELLGSQVPGGNGRDIIFRNILKLSDVSWLQDHKLGESAVVPGAGYLAMAMEALTQATDTDRAAHPAFEFSNVNITNALALDADPTASTEIFTSLHKTAITKAVTSSKWWDFTISTYNDGTAVQHASGYIAIRLDNNESLAPKYTSPEGVLEPTAKRTWYERFTKQGLNYGPTFQSISQFHTPRMKSESIAAASAPLLTACGDPLAVYPVHPTTLDAMIQVAVVAATDGKPKELRAQVPTRIASAIVRTCESTRGGESTRGTGCQMHAKVERTGFGYCQSGLELVTHTGQVMAQFDQLRLAPFHSADLADEDRRHPVLRVLWKPDVYGLGFMAPDAAQSHVQAFADEAHSPVSDDGLLKMGAMLDLLVHKEPRLHILEIGNDVHELTLAVMELLSSKTDFKRLSTYRTAAFTEDGTVCGGLVDLETETRCAQPAVLDQRFDLIIIPRLDEQVSRSLGLIKDLMAENASILALCPASTAGHVTAAGFSCLPIPVSQGQSTLLVARQPSISPDKALRKPRYLIVEREKSKLGCALADALRPLQGHWVMHVPLHQLTADHVPSGTTVFSLCELKDPLLSVISDEDMARVKLMTDNATSLVWVTGGDIMHGERPDFALVSGLSRALMLEQPSLNFYTYDIDQPDEQAELTATRLISLLSQGGHKPDLEFAQRKEVVHVCRFVPDDGINALFRAKQGLETASMRIADVGDVRLAIEHPGQFDTIYFQQLEEAQSMAPTDVRVRVASTGLNAKDFYVLAGRVDTPNATCQLECAGTVVGVGSAVTYFAVGDRVVAMAPTHFQTYQTLPEWACHKLAETESFDVCATLPVVYATAIYALEYRAQLRRGESILIHSGAGGVGIAAIQLALRTGAEVRALSLTLVDIESANRKCRRYSRRFRRSRRNNISLTDSASSQPTSSTPRIRPSSTAYSLPLQDGALMSFSTRLPATSCIPAGNAVRPLVDSSR